MPSLVGQSFDLFVVVQCTYQRCRFRFVFENKPLSSTYIEPQIGFISGIEVRTGIPYIGLIGDLDVRNGVLVGRNIHYVRYSKRSFAYNVREELPAPANTPQAEAMKWSIGLKRMKVDQDGIPSAENWIEFSKHRNGVIYGIRVHRNGSEFQAHRVMN